MSVSMSRSTVHGVFVSERGWFARGRSWMRSYLWAEVGLLMAVLWEAAEQAATCPFLGGWSVSRA